MSHIHSYSVQFHVFQLEYSLCRNVPTKQSVDLSDENVHWEQDISYGQYLDLDDILKILNLPVQVCTMKCCLS